MTPHKISWLNQPGFKGETWPLFVGCTPIQSGCKNCWAARFASGRLKNHRRYKGLTKDGKWTGEVRFHADLLAQPLHWRKPRCIFVAPMGDLFHYRISTGQILDVMGIIAQERCRHHRFINLTKRPERLAGFWTNPKRLSADIVVNKKGHLPNLWQYFSASIQAELDKGLPYLFDSPAAVHGLSLEPLLGPIKLPEPCPHLDHVIIGGESGPGARPLNIDWLDSLVCQGLAMKIPVYVKQDSGLQAGKQGRIPGRMWIQELPKGSDRD